MRAKIKVVGLGQRMSGTSKKNGKHYDFLPISFVFKDDYFTGLRAATANVDGPTVDAAGVPKVEDEREIFYHMYNGQIIVDGIL